MTASAIVVTASSEAEVKAILDADIYGRSGVWDTAKAQIMPVSSILLHAFKFLSFHAHWLSSLDMESKLQF